MVRLFFRGLGTTALGLGLAGVFLPLLPTTVFLIIAVACFLRSDPHRAEKLFADPRFGPTLRAWRDHGAISQRGKASAVGMIALSFVVLLVFAQLDIRAIVVIAAVLTAVSVYILTRPAPKPTKS